jgi:hypothetical protein
LAEAKKTGDQNVASVCQTAIQTIESSAFNTEAAKVVDSKETKLAVFQTLFGLLGHFSKDWNNEFVKSLTSFRQSQQPPSELYDNCTKSRPFEVLETKPLTENQVRLD